MERWERFRPLMEKAKLEIIEFGLDRRDSFAVYQRTFHFYGVPYMSQGHSVVRVADKTVEYGPGDAFLISPGVKHDHIQLAGEQAVFCGGISPMTSQAASMRFGCLTCRTRSG